MVIVSKTILVNFGKIYADAIAHLNRWYELTKSADWKSFSEMKQTFSHVDAVCNDRFVFNIKG